jgi:hypothetical protein
MESMKASGAVAERRERLGEGFLVTITLGHPSIKGARTT